MTENYPTITEENKDYIISIMMSDLVDVFASNLPKKVDPRAWQNLLVYCPVDLLIERLDVANQNAAYQTQFNLENY